MRCSKEDFKPVANEIYGNCYSFNSNITLLSTKYGSKYGLMLELFIGEPESSSPVCNENLTSKTFILVKINFYLKLSINSGAVLFINNKSNINSFFQTGIDLTPGSLTNIGINKMYFAKLPKPYNDCIDKFKQETSYSKFSEMVFKLKGTYNQEDCVELCYQSYLFEKEFSCLNNSRLNIYFHKFDLNECFNLTEKDLILKLKKSISENEFCSKECPTECDSTIHAVSVLSVSDYPSFFYAKLLKKDESIKQKYKNTKNYDFKNSLLAG